jgi:uncharacterized protein YbjT (DUF2867 family)
MILVTGATGTVGRQVVEQLVAADQPVRAAVRDPDHASMPDGVELVPGDLSDPVGLAPHLDGVDAVFLLWPFPAVDLVRKLGGPLEWTHLRPTGFAKNTLMWADQIRAGDVVRWPYPDAARSLIHERDIAAVAVQALIRDELIGKMPVISGPEAITQADQVAAIGTAIGRELRYEDMPRDEATAELIAMFGNADFARTALDTWAGFVTEPEIVTTAVAQITGEPARRFRDWAVEHADDFR